MSHADLPPTTAWFLVGVVAVGTFSIRASFIGLYGWIDELPRAAERALEFMPAAVIAALVVPRIVPAGAAIPGALLDPRPIAAAIAAVVAWRTESIVATIGVGMAVFWGIRFLM